MTESLVKLAFGCNPKTGASACKVLSTVLLCDVRLEGDRLTIYLDSEKPAVAASSF